MAEKKPSRAKVAAGLAYWKGVEVRAHREWQRLVKKGASNKPGTKRYEAYQLYTHAHRMRMRRQMELKKYEFAHIDDKGAAEIAESEGEIPYAYVDSQGWVTAWIGHLVLPMHKGITAADKKKWGAKESPATHASKKEMRDFFRSNDVLPYEKVVYDAVKERVRNGHGSISQNRFNQLVSVTFNIGTGGFASSTMRKRLVAGANAASVADAILMWDQPPEIRGRRQREADRYRRG